MSEGRAGVEPLAHPSYLQSMTDLAQTSESLRSPSGYDLTPPNAEERARLEAALNPEVCFHVVCFCVVHHPRPQ